MKYMTKIAFKIAQNGAVTQNATVGLATWHLHSNQSLYVHDKKY